MLRDFIFKKRNYLIFLINYLKCELKFKLRAEFNAPGLSRSSEIKSEVLEFFLNIYDHF